MNNKLIYEVAQPVKFHQNPSVRYRSVYKWNIHVPRGRCYHLFFNYLGHRLHRTADFHALCLLYDEVLYMEMYLFRIYTLTKHSMMFTVLTPLKPSKLRHILWRHSEYSPSLLPLSPASKLENGQSCIKVIMDCRKETHKKNQVSVVFDLSRDRKWPKRAFPFPVCKWPWKNVYYVHTVTVTNKMYGSPMANRLTPDQLIPSLSVDDVIKRPISPFRHYAHHENPNIKFCD